MIQDRLKELGLAPDKIDRTNQVVLTKWTAVAATGLGWLPADEVAERVIFSGPNIVATD